MRDSLLLKGFFSFFCGKGHKFSFQLKLAREFYGWLKIFHLLSECPIPCFLFIFRGSSLYMFHKYSPLKLEPEFKLHDSKSRRKERTMEFFLNCWLAKRFKAVCDTLRWQQKPVAIQSLTLTFIINLGNALFSEQHANLNMTTCSRHETVLPGNLQTKIQCRQLN